MTAETHKGRLTGHDLQKLGVLRVNIECHLAWIELITTRRFGLSLSRKIGERLFIPGTWYSGVVSSYLSKDGETWTVLFKKIQEERK